LELKTFQISLQKILLIQSVPKNPNFLKFFKRNLAKRESNSFLLLENGTPSPIKTPLKMATPNSRN